MFMMFRSRVIEYLIVANAFMFIVRLAAKDFTRQYLALIPNQVHMMPWTLITSMFVHADFTHILFNMVFGVLMFGGYLERIIGEREYVKIYFLGGLGAGLFFISLSLIFGLPNPSTVAVGASGAVYAVIGALVMLKPNMRIYLYFLFPMPLWVFAGLYLFYSIIAIPSNLGGDVAVTAHLGGLLIGLALGERYKKSIKTPSYTYVRYY